VIFHVSSSFCFFLLARYSFRLFPNFRWDALWGIYSDVTLPYLWPPSLLEAAFFFCYSSTALAGGYSCVTLTLTLTLTLSDFLLFFITCRCPIYQTSVDTVCEEMVAPRFSSSSSLSMLSFSRLYSTSAVGYTDQQTSRLYRPVSVVSHLCLNSSCPCVSNLSNLFVCNVCGFRPFKR